MATDARRAQLVSSFLKAVEANVPKDGKGTTFATAWLATDNIIVHLMHKHVRGLAPRRPRAAAQKGPRPPPPP